MNCCVQRRKTVFLVDFIRIGLLNDPRNIQSSFHGVAQILVAHTLDFTVGRINSQAVRRKRHKCGRGGDSIGFVLRRIDSFAAHKVIHAGSNILKRRVSDSLAKPEHIDVNAGLRILCGHFYVGNFGRIRRPGYADCRNNKRALHCIGAKIRRKSNGSGKISIFSGIILDQILGGTDPLFQKLFCLCVRDANRIQIHISHL